ncbi:hypothetical protein UPYG_G00247850 [Umbra pygmaea]|uniref:Lebercilin domain-containing protein n=1 Tax=Umbra pygmaea TaxID=75934 RepID=A0ABD0W6Z8_UMBPY
MDSENIPFPCKDNRDLDSHQSHRSTGKNSSSRTLKRDKSRDGDEGESCAGDRAKTRVHEPDPDRDKLSDGEHRRSSGSFYSEEYENLTPSERSLSPYSHTSSPGPVGTHAKKVSSSPLYKKGVRRGVSRPQMGMQAQRGRIRGGSHSLNKEKDSSVPPKDLDLVTKRMLSARLLKINELRNALAELQLRTDQLTKENRVLRQLQFRQEKALHRYDDTESEITQLLSRHNNETAALRERLRRAQERERATERRLKDTQELLQRSKSSLGRLRRLAEQQELGPREELTRQLEQEKAKDEENQRKIKDLERHLQLTTSSYQRQLAAERRKSFCTQEQLSALQEEIERLSNKLKEKERELDTRNIYANRMLKASPRPSTDTRTKGPSRYISKAVQTENKKLSLDFPSPPPDINDGNSHYNDQVLDDYLSLKTGASSTYNSSREVERRQNEREEREEREDNEEGRREQELNTREDRSRSLRDGWEKQEEEKRQSQMEEESRRGQVQQEVERRNQEALASQEAAEAERRRKELLLAKLREIDRQNEPHQNEFDSEPPESGSTARSPQRFSELRRQNPSVFSSTEPGGVGVKSGRMGVEDSLGSGLGTGRRDPRARNSPEDLSFGSYAPSFGRPSLRGHSGFPTPPPPSALEAVLGGAEREQDSLGAGLAAGREKKLNLLQQLFGAPTGPPPPSTLTGPRNPREGLFPPSSPAPLRSSLQVTESRPAVRAFASFDDDIEELTL